MASNSKRDVRRPKRSGTGLAAVVLAALMAFVWGFDTLTNSEPDQQTSSEQSTEAPVDANQFSSLPAVDVSALPVEALDTLDLVATNGPYPFDRDGLVFQNREGLLPDRPRGHYQEFTVITPGSDDRGARRIVAGADGELYYTADHYSSFAEIVGWRA